MEHLLQHRTAPSNQQHPLTVRGRGRVVKEPLDESNDSRDVTEQRVSGGRLFIQSGRNLATKVMSNGVEVIVRGDKTAYIGFERTPLVPVPVASRPITLPPSTVSRQFHLVEHPGKPNNAIGHLLNSIVRSATPDMVTKTMVTTFTYLATVLHNQSTIVSTREEVISNVMTQKFRPSIEYTPSLKAEPSTLPPELLQSLVDSSASYFTNTLKTTYTYYNTFTTGSRPVVLTSRETVSNVVTLPAYLSPTIMDMMMSQSRVFETETYYTTFTFSKTLLPDGVDNTRQVVTTKEVVTQVVVTEALIPTATMTPLLTPIAPYGNGYTSTFYTTFTHLFTALNEYGQRVVSSTRSVISSVAGEKSATVAGGYAVNSLKVYDPSNTFMDFIPLATPSISYKITIKDNEVSSIKMEPVLIYATKTYYTTYTYYTTIVGQGSTGSKVKSRTQVMSKIITEALTTNLDAEYVNALKSSYLAKHSTFIEITSSVKEIIPAKTIHVSLRPATTVTQNVFHPHWPKDDDQLAVEVEGTTTEHEANNQLNQQTISGASSEEHFDEMKEGIHKIVNVLTDTHAADDIEILNPTRTYEYLYSTMPEIVSEPLDEVTEIFQEVNLKEPDFDYGTTASETDADLTEKPISHMPTPPLKKHKPSTAINTLVDPFLQQTDMFPNIGPPKSVLIDYPTDILDYSDEVYGDLSFGDISSLVDIYVSRDRENDKSISNAHSIGVGSSISIGGHHKRKSSVTFQLVSSTVVSEKFDRTQAIFNLLDEITSNSGEIYDELKTSEETNETPNVYNISTTFDTYTYNLNKQKIEEEMKKNQTLLDSKNATTTSEKVTNKKKPNVTRPAVQIKEEITTTDLSSTDLNDDFGDVLVTEEPVVAVTEDDPETVDDSTSQNEETTNPTTRRPTRKPYRTSPKPKRKTTKPPPAPQRESEESSETSTTIYSVGTIPLNDNINGESNSHSEEDDQQADTNDSDTDEVLDDSGEAEHRRPFHPGGGPSKSSLAIPTIGSGVAAGSQVVSATATGYNWKPLLNLGAIGLGGLGASGLTKLGPLFHSMAGYMKGALLPMARNDTFQKNSEVNTHERPFHRFPPKEGAIVSFNEPVYIPVGSHASSNNKNPSFRTPDDRIPRRPIINHANSDNNFRAPMNDGREPDVILGPLPPPVHFDSSMIGPSPSFPPTHNYNFKPPNDEQPNIFSQMEDELKVNKHGGVVTSQFEKQTPSSNVIKVVAGNQVEVNRSPSSQPPTLTSPEAKTDVIMRPLSNLLNGRPMFSSEPSQHPPMWSRPPQSHSHEIQNPGPTRFVNRPEPGRGSSSEINIVSRPGFKRGPNENEIRDVLMRPYSTLEPYNMPRPGMDIPPRKPITPDNVNIPRPTRPAMRPQNPPWSEGSKVLLNSVEMSAEADNRNPFNFNNGHIHRIKNQNIHSQERPGRRPDMFIKNPGAESPTFHTQNGEPFFPQPNMFSPENIHRMPTPPTPPAMRPPDFPEFSDFLPDLEPTIGHRFPEDIGMSSNPLLPFQNERPFFQGAIEIQHADNRPKPNFGKRPVFRRPVVQHTGAYERPTAQTKPQSHENQSFGSNRPGILHDNSNNNHETQNSEETQYRPPKHPLGRPFLTEIKNTQDGPHSGENVYRSPNNGKRNPLIRNHGPQGQLIFGPHNEDDRRNPFVPIPSSSEENMFRPNRNNKNGNQPVRQPFRPPPGALRPNRNQYAHSTIPSPTTTTPANYDIDNHEDEKSAEETNSVHQHHASQERPMPTSYNNFHNENVEQTEINNEQSFNSGKIDQSSNNRFPQQSPQYPNPTPHYPPYKQRPSTVYIVHETYDTPTTPTTTTTTEIPETSPIPHFRRPTTEYPKLIIKEIPTKAVVPYYSTSATTTTTRAPQTPPTFLSNRATISKLFIRRFTTPFTTTSTTPKPIVDSYIVSPTVNDLLSFEEKFVNKYGMSRTTPNPNNRFAGKLPNNRFSAQINLGNHKVEEPDRDETKNMGNVTQVIQKPFLNLDKYFTNVGDTRPNFGQDPSGSEDTDTIIDPVNHQVIKSPFDAQHTTEAPTTTPTSITTTHAPLSSSSEETLLSEFSLPEGVFSSSPPSGSNLWWPTTYRPKNHPSLNPNEIEDKVSVDGVDDDDVKPTTFRGPELVPTTYRPRPFSSRFQPGRDVDIIRNKIRRPAPQAGMASFYDDEDSMDQLKLKNVEIHKEPGSIRKPIIPTRGPVPSFGGIIDSLEEYDSAGEDSHETGHESKKIEKKPNPDKEKAGNNEYNGDAYDDDDTSLELSPPGYPAHNLRPPSPPNNYNDNGVPSLNEKPINSNNNNNGKPISFFREPSTEMRPPAPQSKRPGPLQALTNIFRRPNRPLRPDNQVSSTNHGPPGQGGRRPFPQPPPPQRRPNPNGNFNQRPFPPRGPNQRPPEIEYQENNFNQMVKTIPLNPNAAEQEENKGQNNQQQTSHNDEASDDEKNDKNKAQEQIEIINGDNPNADEANKINIEDQKKTPSNQSPNPEDPKLDQVSTGTGHRESSYGEEDYYEDEDDDLINNDKNNVLPPGSENQGPPPINYPKLPQQQSPHRPFNIGGHMANNDRPQFSQGPQRFPPPPRQHGGGQPFPQRPLPPPGSNNGFKFERPESHDPFRFPPGPPKTELEPPPIDSNRIKQPVLELPSNGPIRYRPNGPNQIRPNLLRPEEELFKPTPPRTTIHTIASVDHDNKILGTNTFTAILPSQELASAAIRPTESSDTPSNIKPTDSVQLEGSESTALPAAESSAASESTTSISHVVKYSGGKLQTSAVTHNAVAGQPSVKPHIRSVIKMVTKTSLIHRTRGPAASLPTEIEIKPTKSSEINSQTTSASGTTKYTIVNRRPTGRPTTTIPTTTTLPSETDTPTKISVRKPFLPTRGPNLATPWNRRSTTTSTTTPKPINVTDSPSEVQPTTIRFSPPIANISKIINKFENRVRGTTTPVAITTTTTGSTTTKATSSVGKDEAKQGSSNSNVSVGKETPKFTISPDLMRPTTYRPPFRRPGSSSRERFTTVITKIITTSSPPLSSVSSKSSETSIRNSTRIKTSSSSTIAPGSSEDYEYEDDDEEEYEEESEENSSTAGAGIIDKMNVTRTFTGQSGRVNATTAPEASNKTTTTTISPTRVTQRGRFKSTNLLIPSRTRGTPFSSSTTQGTRYVTHTETKTQTLTETEITVVTSSGSPMTHTIMITKTLPPQTLISTIVGTVTLVNSVEVKPTTVRTTIFAEPTKAVYSFVDTSENTKKNEVVTEKILRGGVLGGGNTRESFRPPSPPVQNKPIPGIPPVNPSIPTRNRPPYGVSENAGCSANCSSGGNQMCRTYVNGTKPKCDCKPGYARMKPKFPCRPTFTYELGIAVNHMEGMSFDFKDLQNAESDAYQSFITVTKDAIDKAFLATDIKRQFQGAEIVKVNPRVILNDRTREPEPKVNVDFLVQLTTNVTEERIKNHLIRTLKTTNYSIGSTGISSTKVFSDFSAKDFNECVVRDFNDCSMHSDCINLKGSYTCKCKPGYKDKLIKKHRPGRDCYAIDGCADCNYKGNCHIDMHGNQSCNCFRWYGGAECQINLKVLLISIIGIGVILFLLVLLCGILVCRRNKMNRERPGSGRFMRYRSPTSQATLDRAAIMNDSSSDGSQTPPVRNTNPAFTPDSLLIETDPKGPSRGPGSSDVNLMNFSLRNVVMDQDRSLTVVIPRAKIRPSSRPQSNSHLVAAAMGPDTNADLASTERKLISYLDQSPYPPSVHMSFGPTTSHSSTMRRNADKAFRKLSLQEQRKISTGALVSSGTEVSARGGMRRRSIGLEPEPFYKGYEKSVSEVRSFDETIRSPSKQHIYATETSRQSCYSHCKPPSYCAYSEGHTMAEKDGASTVYTTQGKLFRMMNDDSDSSVCE